MFKLNKKYANNRHILKCDYIRYSTSEIFRKNTANSQIYNNIHREDSVTSLLNGCLDLNFDVVHAATNNRYADSIYKLTTSSGKLLKMSVMHIL